MGLFSNPLGHAGYPPNPQTCTVVNSTVRAATAVEVAAGLLNDVYVSPATASSLDAGLFASPPALGNSAPNAVNATTLTSTSNTSLATAVAATALNLANSANTGALVVNIAAGESGANSTVNILTGTPTAGTQILNLLSSSGKLGFFGATAVVKQTQAALTKNVTASGTTSVLADFTSLTVYATDAAAIHGDIYQLGLSVSGIITALKAYGIM